MPNLQGKIELIKQAQVDIKNAIIDKGVTPTGNISTYADAIDNIVTPNNQTKTVTENGIVRYDTGYTGLEQVTVSLPLNSKNITTNGTYNASADNLQGYNSVTVNVQPDVNTKTITANGTYNASNDNLDGYDEVIVNVSSPINDLIDGSITEVDTNVSTIKSGAFKDCEDLDTVVLRSNTVVDLSDDTIFENTPIASKTGNIYVPDGLVDSYKWGTKKNWTSAVQDSQLATQTGWQSITYGNGIYLARGGLNNKYLSTSTDGINWATPYEAVYDDGDFTLTQSVAYGNGVFVATGINSSFVSTNAIRWRVANTIVSDSSTNVIFDGEKFVVIDILFRHLRTSTNGTNWQVTGTYSVFAYATYLAFNGSKYVINGQNGMMMTSTNLVDWRETQPTGITPQFATVMHMGYDGSRFFGIYNGQISYSTDGINWTTPVTDSNLGNHNWSGSITNDIKTVLISSDGYISYSEPKYNFLPISQLPS